MMAIIAVGTYAGHFIDQSFSFSFPAFTLVLSLSSVALAVYFVYRKTIEKNNNG